MTPKENIEQKAILTMAHLDFAKGLNLHAYFKVHQHAMGEDLVQDTFLKTWNYLVKGGKIDVMKSFLYHILNNLIIDQYRKHKTGSLDDLMEAGFEPGEDNKDRLFDMLDGKKALVLIKKLPVVYQNLMRMRYIEDLSLKEISEITGQTTNSIAVLIHRGVKKLKVLYLPA